MKQTLNKKTGLNSYHSSHSAWQHCQQRGRRQLCSEQRTYTVVPGVQEVEELLCALLLGLGAGGHPRVTQLQPLPRLHAFLRLLAVLPHRGQGVLRTRGCSEHTDSPEHRFPPSPSASGGIPTPTAQPGLPAELRIAGTARPRQSPPSLFVGADGPGQQPLAAVSPRRGSPSYHELFLFLQKEKRAQRYRPPARPGVPCGPGAAPRSPQAPRAAPSRSRRTEGLRRVTRRKRRRPRRKRKRSLRRAVLGPGTRPFQTWQPTAVTRVAVPRRLLLRSRLSYPFLLCVLASEPARPSAATDLSTALLARPPQHGRPLLPLPKMAARCGRSVLEAAMAAERPRSLFALSAAAVSRSMAALERDVWGKARAARGDGARGLGLPAPCRPLPLALRSAARAPPAGPPAAPHRLPSRAGRGRRAESR